MAQVKDDLLDIDNLDLEDKLKWLKEILENGRENFIGVELGDKLSTFIEKLAEDKIISGFNKKKLNDLNRETEIIEELHRILPTKGWDNFKKARQILYDIFPDLSGIWDEEHVNDLPVLSVKYSEFDGAVAVDGVSSSAASCVDGLFSSSKTYDDIGKTDIPIQLNSLPAYTMNRRYRGMCMIVNNEKYDRARDNDKDFKDRRGSSKDAESIRSLFKSLGFQVEYQKDLSKAKLDKLIDMMVRFKGLKEHSCFVGVFLSHGENEQLNCCDGQDKKIDDIINAFKGDNCPALSGIPKWFIIQACRGKDFNYEVSVDHDAPGEEDRNDVERQSDKPISIPACADFYISYATAPGYYSFRNINEGSWFINDLVKVIREYSDKEDVNTMMTRVNRNVAFGRVVQSDFGHRRQMPCHVNMLTSALYLGNDRSSQI